MSDTPELDRQAEIIHSGKAEIVQGFIDWLPEGGYVLMKICMSPAHESYERWCQVCNGHGATGPEMDFQRIMAEHFGIDLDKIEQERRLLLGQIRNSNLGREKG